MKNRLKTYQMELIIIIHKPNGYLKRSTLEALKRVMFGRSTDLCLILLRNLPIKIIVVSPFRLHLQLRGQFWINTRFPIQPYLGTNINILSSNYRLHDSQRFSNLIFIFFLFDRNNHSERSTFINLAMNSDTSAMGFNNVLSNSKP